MPIFSPGYTGFSQRCSRLSTKELCGMPGNFASKIKKYLVFAAGPAFFSCTGRAGMIQFSLPDQKIRKRAR
jgi:hypothetical protein